MTGAEIPDGAGGGVAQAIYLVNAPVVGGERIGDGDGTSEAGLVAEEGGGGVGGGFNRSQIGAEINIMGDGGAGGGGGPRKGNREGIRVHMLVGVGWHRGVGDAGGVGRVDLKAVQHHVLGVRSHGGVGREEHGGNGGGRGDGKLEVGDGGEDIGRADRGRDRGDVGAVEVNLDGGHGAEASWKRRRVTRVVVGEQGVRSGGEAGEGHLNLSAGVKNIGGDRDAVADQLLTVGGNSGLVVGAIKSGAAGGLSGCGHGE
ncbi:MAG: hypothetical protein RIQ79_2606 [Verrucomicrobiota bacterium]